MGKFVSAAIGIAVTAIGAVTGQPWLVQIGVSMTISGLASALLAPGGPKRRTAGSSVQIGEVPREGVFGEAAVPGSLVDAFNYGGKYGTDWTVLTIALADHECESLEGFYVYNDYVAFTGDGDVAGYHGQLQVFFRPGTWDQEVPAILTANAPVYPAGHPLAGTPTWTAADRGRGVCYVVVAYKADKSDAKNPVWSSGQPTFLWKLKGLKVYSAREDDTVGGEGDHRWDDVATRVWSPNLIDCRYTWVRGIYVRGHVDDPKYLLLGRGLTAEEAPPEAVFAPANLCDEDVPLKAGGAEKRYRIGGLFGGADAYIDTENALAAACGGIIVDRAGSVELVPGAAEAAVWFIGDDDLVEQTTVTARDFRSKTDAAWVNMVSPAYIEPTQKWASHAAPLRRDNADIAADGEPRLGQPQLELVTSGTQAQRVGEMIRRKGRLWRTRGLTLGPRFAGAEHGDWLVWTSRRYGPRGEPPGTPLTFRIVSDGQGPDWRNQLALEEIAAGVFAWDAEADELVDGAVAVNSPRLPDVGAPDAASWSLSAIELGGAPALRFAGDSGDDGAAAAVVFEYAASASAPDAEDDGAWQPGGGRGATVTSTQTDVAGVLPGTIYWGAVSYLTEFGTRSDRLVLGPVTTGAGIGAVTGLSAAGGAGQAVVSGSAPAGAGVTQVRVYRNTSAVFGGAVQVGIDIAVSPGIGFALTDSGLSAGTKYYWARAFDGAGNPSAVTGPVIATIT